MRRTHVFYTDRAGRVHPITQPGAGAGAIDNPQKFAPTGPGSSPVYVDGRHVGYVYKSGRGWWAEYMGGRRHPSPYYLRRSRPPIRNGSAPSCSKRSKHDSPR